MTGINGEKGIKGCKGELGESGSKGDKGDKGEIGPLGNTGPSGSDGIDGIKGEKGTKGESGEIPSQLGVMPYEPYNINTVLAQFNLENTWTYFVEFIAPTKGIYTNLRFYVGDNSTPQFSGSVHVGVYKNVFNSNYPSGHPQDLLADGEEEYGSQDLRKKFISIKFQSPVELIGNEHYWVAISVRSPSGNRLGSYYHVDYNSINRVVKLLKSVTLPDNTAAYNVENSEFAYWFRIYNEEGVLGGPGVKGEQGDPGPQGPIGLTGSTGPTGPSGADGPKGMKGEPGPTGEGGPAGADGEAGPKGDRGFDGNSSIWKWNENGGVFPNQFCGLAGANFTHVYEDIDQLWVNALDCNNINLSEWINNIEVGDIITIRNVEDITRVVYYTVTSSGVESDNLSTGFYINVTYLDGDSGNFSSTIPNPLEEYYIGYVRSGTSGPKGMKGEPGSASDKGEKGEPGLDGPPGAAGADGAPGAKGMKGEPGSASEKGQKGEPGIDGPTGATGPAGADGPTGPTGETGPDHGPAGADGPAGPTGPWSNWTCRC